ncbi:MAG: tryptophan 2,3-dioxygenase family protein [Saprospiraceae bacterium]
MPPPDEKYSAVHYSDYLNLDKLLTAQNLRSVAFGDPAHDEHLFIIVHQVYELWFKQIVHELRSVMKMFELDNVDERSIGTTVARMERVVDIQKLLIEQIRVMESLTPLDFLDFRNYLFPASGFQSLQFRMIEVLLGLKNPYRITYNSIHYSQVFGQQEKELLNELENGQSMLQLVERWLERIPFIQTGRYPFLEKYSEAVTHMIQKEKTAILDTNILTDAEKEQRLKMLGDTDTYFQSVLDPVKHEEMIADGRLKLSYKASIAALFINLYRDEPILHTPFTMLSRLMDIDEYLTLWRYRHAQMVLRMLGRKIGTGGSSGYDYLQATAAKHHIFIDLHNISTLLIPRSELPVLPPDLKRELGFYFSAHNA